MLSYKDKMFPNLLAYSDLKIKYLNKRTQFFNSWKHHQILSILDFAISYITRNFTAKITAAVCIINLLIF